MTDDRGRFVPGLKQSDFQVSEDGVSQKISSFSGERTPLELVTAIDVSSSVTQALPDMKTAATRFLGGLDATDQATVVGFNDSIYTLARRSTDQMVRERAIGRLKAWGGTALYDAIVHSIDRQRYYEALRGDHLGLTSLYLEAVQTTAETEMRVYDEATKAPTKRRSKKQSAG